MRYLTKSASILALTFSVGLFCSLSAQSSTGTASPRVGGATVSGSITVQGKPKAGIVVMIRGRDFTPQGQPAPKGVSDADGNYQISNIPAGTYQVVPVSPVYILLDRTWMSGLGKALVLAEGERVQDIDFELARGSVVTGKVTHADGRPVVEENVYLISAEKSEPGVRRASHEGYAATDDRGIYRIFGVKAGRYKVSVGMPEDALASVRNRPALERVFAPGTVNFEEAKEIELGEGAEVANIDIVVGQPVRGYVVSGTILDGESNQPVPGIRLGIQKTVDSTFAPFIGTPSVSNARGEFRLENLPPGKYTVFVMSQPNSEALIEPLRFEVTDEDVAGLVLKTAKGSSISGFVTLEGMPSRDVQAKLSKLRVFAYVRREQGSPMASSRSSTLGPDGSFRVGGLAPGIVMLSVGQAGQPQSDYIVSRIEREGVAIAQRTGMEVKSGEHLAGIKIILVHGTGSIRGSVKWGDGPLPPGVRLVVRLAKAEDPSTPIAAQEVDARGRFAFQGVPDGNYEVVLSSFLRVGSNPLSVRQTVNVTDGAVAEIELLVNTGPKPLANP